MDDINYSDFCKPSLIEPGVKYLLSNSLKQCNEFRNKYINQIYNFCLFLIFIIVLIIILVSKYKGKPTQKEKHIQNYKKKQYILSKIKSYQDTKKMASQQLITGLPNWNSEYDLVNNIML